MSIPTHSVEDTITVRYEVLGDACFEFIDALDEDERARLARAVARHEAPLANDHSDGPTVAFYEDREALYDECFSCCGWAQTTIGLFGNPTGDPRTPLVVGTNHGH